MRHQENSPQRGNVAENGGAAQTAAKPMRVADFSVKGTEQTCCLGLLRFKDSDSRPMHRTLGPFALAPADSRACFPRDFPRRSHSPHSFPRNVPRRSRGAALACPPLSANVIGGRTTSLSKQSLRTCNVDNELRQALVLLRCPPILADWRTTINAELAHYPRGRICGTVSIRGPVALLLVRTATRSVCQRTYSDGVTGPPWPCYSGVWPCDSELGGIARTRFCDCLVAPAAIATAQLNCSSGT